MNKSDISTVILAAGSGDRLGGIGKAFIEAERKSYLSRAVKLFSQVSKQIIVSVHAEDLSRVEKSAQHYACQFVEGGQTRQDSFENAFKKVTGSFVIVHDVARPLTTINLVHRVLEAAHEYDAVAPTVAVKVRDSLSYVEDGFIGASAARDNLVSLQTPQAYNCNILAGILTKARKESWKEVSIVPLVRRAGVKVKTVEGDTDNIKVTYPEDIEFVEQILKQRGNETF